ncbi:porimin [Lepus europaeus]|uniref:porimin n=1 Tax=Lepus europaeus TaxID=9983 RepID=UPI002B460E50|nr:porimin [Lepus europaeus]
MKTDSDEVSACGFGEGGKHSDHGTPSHYTSGGTSSREQTHTEPPDSSNRPTKAWNAWCLLFVHRERGEGAAGWLVEATDGPVNLELVYDCSGPLRQICKRLATGLGTDPYPNAAAPLSSRTPLGSRPHLLLPAPPPRCTHPAPRPKTTLQRLPSGPREAQRARIRSGTAGLAFIRDNKTAASWHTDSRATGAPGPALQAPQSHRARPRPRPRPGSARGAPSSPAPAPYLVIREAGGGKSGSVGAEGRAAGSVRSLRGCSPRRSRRHLGRGPTRPPRPALGTMGLRPRGAWAVLLLGALQVLALLGTALSAQDPPGTSDIKNLVSLQNSTANSTDKTQPVPSNNTSEPSGSAVNSSTSAASTLSNMTATTVKPTSKMAPTPGVSNVTSTTLKSTSKTSVSHNTAQMSTSSMTTTHSSTATSVSSSATITATIHSEESKRSKFDTGSFVGGIVLTLGVLSILYIGCKMYYSRRGIRYRTIDEHDAII